MPGTAQAGGDLKLVPVQAGFFHDVRATVDYNYREGPLVDVDLTHDGDAHTHQVLFGLESGLGSRGFGRIEFGVDSGDSNRVLRFDDMTGHTGGRFFGASGGIFLFRFLAVGVQGRYGTGEEKDKQVNRAIGDVTRTSRSDEDWRIAPFALLTAPVGPVQLSLLGGYVHVGRQSNYADPTLPDHDKASMDLWVVNFGADWRVIAKLKIGANIGWTEIFHQDLQAGAVALDKNWGSVDGHVSYELFHGFDVTLRGGRDFANDQGNGYRIGGGLAYRF